MIKFPPFANGSATQEPEGSGREGSGQDGSEMLVRMLELDYRFLTGAITLGSFDQRNETFEQRSSLVKQLEGVPVNLEDPAKKVNIGMLLIVEQTNEEGLGANLDLLEVNRDERQLRVVAY